MSLARRPRLKHTQRLFQGDILEPSKKHSLLFKAVQCCDANKESNTVMKIFINVSSRERIVTQDSRPSEANISVTVLMATNLNFAETRRRKKLSVEGKL